MNIFQNRRAVRNYKKEEISDKKIREILLAAMYAPSGYDKHPLEFVIVKDVSTKENLALTNQWSFYADRAAAIIAVCVDPDQSLVWLEDASIAVGYMWLRAAQLKLGACWVHVKDSVRTDGSSGENYVKKILEIPQKFRVVCFLCLGRPVVKAPKHTKKEYLSEKIHCEKW